MHPLKVAAIALALIALFPGGLLAGERHAFILCAKSGEQSLYETNKSYCERTRDALLANDFPKGSIDIFIEGGASSIAVASEADAAKVLARLEELSSSLKDADELWLFIYGDANVNQRGVSIACQGKRLYGKQLAEALDKIKARQFAFCLSRQSSELLECLSSPNRFVLTATSDSSQLNPPLLPGFLLEQFETSPQSPIIETIKKAAENTKLHYESSGLGLAEIPQIFDGESILRPPFEKASEKLAKLALKSEEASSRQTLSSQSLAGPDVQPVIKDKAEQGDALATSPANDETKGLIEKASKLAASHKGFSAFVLSSSTAFSVGNGFATSHAASSTTCLIDDVAAEDFASTSFVDSPPDTETSILKARLIFPDGSFIDVKPETTPYDIKLNRRISILKFPGARAGCIIQLETRTDEKASFQTPFFSSGFEAQRNIPVEDCSISISFPKTMEMHCKASSRRSRQAPT